MSLARRHLAQALLVWTLPVWALSPGCRQDPARRAADGDPGRDSAPPEGQPARRLEIAGAPNAWRVSDDLIRGGQPTRAGFEILRGCIRDLDFQAVMDDVTAYR